MARTKQTSKKQSNKAEKAPISAGKKRKLENTECDGNERKKIKLDVDDESSSSSHDEEHDESSDSSNSSDSSTSLTSSTTSSSDDDDEDDDIAMDKKPTFPQQMNTAITSIDDILRSTNYSRSQILKFSKKLQKMAEDAQTKAEELEYREKAYNNFFQTFENKMNSRRDWTKYFNTKILEFSKSMIKAFRYYKEERSEEWEFAYCSHYVDYSVDIALKTNIIHPKFDKNVYSLIGKHVNNISCISRIIAEYANNGYRWYRMQITHQIDAECDMQWTELSCPGILRHVTYDIDDYFHDNKFYKEGIYDGECVKFASWRKELDCDLMRKMSDTELAQFIIAIGITIFDFEGLKNREEWIVKQHKLHLSLIL